MKAKFESYPSASSMPEELDDVFEFTFLDDANKLKARQPAYEYFRRQAKLTTEDRQRGVRIYLNPQVTREQVEPFCGRVTGYASDVRSRGLAKKRVIASSCHYVGDGVGNYFPEAPVPAIMLTCCMPNLRKNRHGEAENPFDYSTFVKKDGTLNQAEYASIVKEVLGAVDN